MNLSDHEKKLYIIYDRVLELDPCIFHSSPISKVLDVEISLNISRYAWDASSTSSLLKHSAYQKASTASLYSPQSVASLKLMGTPAAPAKAFP
jgi:hypothetical protein